MGPFFLAGELSDLARRATLERVDALLAGVEQSDAFDYWKLKWIFKRRGKAWIDQTVADIQRLEMVKTEDA